VLGGHCAVVLGLEHARTIARYSWTRNDIKNYLWLNSGNRFDALSRGHRYGKVYNRNLPKWYKREPDSRIPIVESSDRIHLFVVGGHAGRFSAFIPGWGHMSTPVLRPITGPSIMSNEQCDDGSDARKQSMRQENSPPFLFDPRGIVNLAINPGAPRKTRLDGLRLGILDNSKWNANKLLRGASAALSANIKFTSVIYYVKQSFSKDAAPELIEQIAQENDIVLTAIGDCGSCCSCCIRDALAHEKLSIPTAAIITTEFVKETELTVQALGMPNFTPIAIDHPISSITNEEIDRRVCQIEEQAKKIWTAC